MSDNKEILGVSAEQQTFGGGASQPEPQPPKVRGLSQDSRAEVPSLLQAIRSNQGLEVFLDDLRLQQEHVLDRVGQFIREPGKTPDEVALGIYLDAVLKSNVFGLDPFVPRFPGDEEHQQEREDIAAAAVDRVARAWHRVQPHSSAAESVADLNVLAPVISHQTLLYELWPEISVRMA